MHSVMQDYIPPAIGLPIAAMLWIIIMVIWFKAPVMRKVDNFFAHRRHVRRMRRYDKKDEGYHKAVAYSSGDVELAQKFFDRMNKDTDLNTITR